MQNAEHVLVGQPRNIAGCLVLSALLCLTTVSQAYAGEWREVDVGTGIHQPWPSVLSTDCLAVTLDLTTGQPGKEREVDVQWTMQVADPIPSESKAKVLQSEKDPWSGFLLERPLWGAPPFEAPRGWMLDTTNPLSYLTGGDRELTKTLAIGDHSSSAILRQYRSTAESSAVWYTHKGIARPLLTLYISRYLPKCHVPDAQVHVHTSADWRLSSAMPVALAEPGHWQVTWRATDLPRQFLFLTLPEPSPAWSYGFEIGFWLLLLGCGTLGFYGETQFRRARALWWVLPVGLVCTGFAHAWAVIALYDWIRDFVGGLLIGGWPSTRPPYFHNSAWFIIDIPSGAAAFVLGACLGWFRYKWRTRARIPHK